LTYSGFGNANSLSGSFNSSSFRFLGGNFPGSTGSCGSTVSSGTCTIVVEFVPGTTGSHSATLTLNYSNDNGTARSASTSLTGTGLAPANLQISGTANISPTVNGSTANFDLTLSNTGGTAALSITAASLSSPFKFQGSGSYPGGGTCGGVLNANSSCTIKLAYTPTISGSHSATLTLTYNNGISSSQTVSQALTGSSGSVASLTANPTSLAFGQVVVNQSSTLSFTLQNAASTVPATSISVSGLSTPFTVTSNGCSQLTASSSCSISIRYQPSTNGTFSQTAIITYNNGSTTTSVSLGVTGTTPASYTISPEDDNPLGNLPAGVAQKLTYTITRTGGPVSTSLSGSTFTMNLGSGTFGYAGGTFPGSNGTCTNPMTLSSCTVVLEVTPTNQGTFSGTWTLQADTGNGTTTLSRTFSINSVPTSYAISPADNTNVGDRGAGATHLFTYTLTRTGGPPSTALTGSSFTSSGAGTLGYAGGAFPGTEGTCTNPMTTSSCTIVVAMNLTGAGAFSGTWSIQAGTGAGNTTLSRTLLGNSVAASYTVSPANNNNVGDKATAATHLFTYTITRTGGPSSTALTGSSFTSTGTGSLNYAGGSFPGTEGTCTNPMITSSCTVVLAMTLTGLGDFSGTWSINTATGVGNTTLSRTILGTAKNRAAFRLSDNTLIFPPANVGQTSQAALVVENTGAISFTNLSGAVTSSISSVFRFPGGNFPGRGGSCNLRLEPNQSCTVVLEYAPTSSASVSGSFTVQGHNGAETVSQSVTLQTPSSSIGAAKPTLALPDFSQPRRWAIRDIDDDGYWDQLWLPSEDAQVVIVISSATHSEIARISFEEAVPLILGEPGQ
ncbi:MAG: choice-of-anchor D domain-containing protein, partial [Bdellovibrionales bacterium]|nr:choice-of-anchor D domain-containing protein [Bdellovibrionales bacterium]